MKIEARPKGAGPWKTITPEALAEFCLHRAGGGYTPAQTAKAMQLQREIIDAGQWANNNLEIQVTED